MRSQRTPVRSGFAQFTVYAPGVIRLQYNKHGYFPKASSIVTAKELPRPVFADVSRTGKKVVIKTEKLTLTYRDDGMEFSKDNLSIIHPGTPYKIQYGHSTTKPFWNPGDVDQPLGEMVRSLDEWPQWKGFSRDEHPVVLDLLGRRCIVDDAQVYRTRDNSWVEVTPKDRRGQDWWFFGYGTDYIQALKDFRLIFGPIPLVPRWVFGFWYSRWYEFTSEDILNIARKYRKSGLPMDVMVVDTEWRKGIWNGFDWNKKLFKNPRKFIADLKKMGLIVPLNDHPGYYEVDPLPSDDSLIPVMKRQLSEPPHKGTWACNWSSKSCTELWKKTVLEKPFKEGIDFWWVDGWADETFKGVNRQFWMNRHYYEVAENATGKRGLILSRWGGWGSHRFPIQFSGDTESNWYTLEHQISFTAESGGAGACYWSHDIGGFVGKIIPDDLFIRWVQFGAFSPIFRTHSAFGTREPFAYSKLAQKVFKQVTRQRYALVPYYYHLAREAYDTGLPIIRPMFLHYPELKTVYKFRYQYLIGKDVLIVPAHSPGEVCKLDWYTPPGMWVRPETGEVFRGDTKRRISIALNEIPVFYRLASIIPHQEVGETTRQTQFGPLHLDIYPDNSEVAELDLYEDDGETRDFETGKFSRTKVTCSKSETSIIIEARPPRGVFKGLPKERNLILNVWLDSRENVEAVHLNARKLSKSEWKVTNSYAAKVCKGKAQFVRIPCALKKEKLKIKLTLI